MIKWIIKNWIIDIVIGILVLSVAIRILRIQYMIYRLLKLFCVFIFAYIFVCPLTFAQGEDEDHSVVLMLGGAIEQGISETNTNFGPSISAEFNVIPEWLEIEIGTQFLTTNQPHELGGQIIFKKPFSLTSNTEVMLGVGPTINRQFTSEAQGNQYGMALQVDFMFWNSKNSGWFVSPEYNFGVGASNDRSIGLTFGLIYGF